jgi:energy-coupling factor transport system substrate-specific component
LSLPLWLDTTGIIVATVMGGTLPGIITAIVNHIINAILYYKAGSLLYVIVSVIMVLVLSYSFKKRYIKNFLSLMGLFFLILLIYSFLGAIISALVFHGYTNYAPVDSLFITRTEGNSNINMFFACFTIRLYVGFFDLILSSLLAGIFYFILDRYTPFNFK